MYTIGLTGGICTGKSIILEILKELECYTVQSDQIAKQIIFSNNPEITDKIVQVFGDEICDEKAGIHKERFARILFEDSEKRNFINNFIHPLVVEERKKIIHDLMKTKVYELFVYESALLVEAGTHKDFDKIIVAYTTPDEQLHRLMERDKISREEAEERIKSQFPLNEKLKVAHYTIDTTGSLENTRAKTLETFHLIKKDLDLS